MIVKKHGTQSILAIAQDQTDMDLLQRMQSGMVGVRRDVGGQMRLEIMPDIKAYATNQPSRFAGKSVDDLATEAIQKGLPIKKDTLRDDLEKILETAETDMALATMMAEKARPAMSGVNRPLTQGRNDGVHGARTLNASGVAQTPGAAEFDKLGW